jgi:hypothetical protein
MIRKSTRKNNCPLTPIDRHLKGREAEPDNATPQKKMSSLAKYGSKLFHARVKRPTYGHQRYQVSYMRLTSAAPNKKPALTSGLN